MEGLIGLLDDVSAALAQATARTTGLVVDDTAVTPQYLHSYRQGISWRL